MGRKTRRLFDPTHPFLEYLATQPVKDVRPILKSFNDKSNMLAEFQAREAKLREKWRAENKHLFENRPNAGNFLGKMMGMPTSTLNKESKMPFGFDQRTRSITIRTFPKVFERKCS